MPASSLPDSALVRRPLAADFLFHSAIQVSTRKRESAIHDRMFDSPETDDLDAVSCARALEAVVLEQRRVGARRFSLVAQWADTHPPRPGGPARAVQPGSTGTPDVDEFTAT